MTIKASSYSLTVFKSTDGIHEISTFLAPVFGGINDDGTTNCVDAKVSFEEGDGGTCIVIKTDKGTLALFGGRDVGFSVDR